MAHPFGDQDQGSGGGVKRPSQTIEGTATEIKAEPAAAEKASSEPRAEPDTSGAAPSGDPGPSQAAAAPPPRPGRVKSFFTHCLAGLVGGLVGVGALGYAWSGLNLGQGAAPEPDVVALEQRLDKLEAAPSADAEALSALKTQIAALETSVKEALPKLAGLADRVAQLEASLKTLADTASEGGSVATAAAIAQQISEAEQRLDAKIAAALAEGKGATAPALEQMRSEIAELKAKLGALAEAELGTGNSPDLAVLTERIAKLEASLPEIVSAIDKEQAGAKSAAVAIAFANLRAAVSDGRPYAAELDTIGALAPSVGDLGMLPAYAETGIPTLPALGRSFTTASDKALAAVATPAGGSLVDNLLASAQSLVTIRRIDEAPAAEGPAATLARAKAALDQGDLAAAVKDIETLDGAMGEAYSAWLGEARARLGADQTLTRLEGALLVSMSGEGQQR
jgi:hypothetical protein